MLKYQSTNHKLSTHANVCQYPPELFDLIPVSGRRFGTKRSLIRSRKAKLGRICRCLHISRGLVPSSGIPPARSNNLDSPFQEEGHWIRS